MDMAGIPSGFKAPRARAENDLYTAMLGIAGVFVLAAVVFVIIRCIDLFGTPFPGFSG